MSVQDPIKPNLNKLNLTNIIKSQPRKIGSFLDSGDTRSLVSVSKITRSAFLNNADIREQLEMSLGNACVSNNCKFIEELLSIEPKLINMQEKSNGYTPIMLAIVYGNTEAFNLLCQYNPNINILLDGNQSALWFAARWRRWPFVTQLIKMGARHFDESPVSGPNAGITAFWITVCLKQWDLAMEMLKLGAKSCDQVPSNHHESGSALMIASASRQWDLVQKMIENGARGFDQSRKLKADCGATPLWYAVRYEQWSIANLMRRFGAKDMNACPKDGPNKGLTVWDVAKYLSHKYSETKRKREQLSITQSSIIQSSQKQLPRGPVSQLQPSKDQPSKDQPSYKLLSLEGDSNYNPVLEALKKKYEEEQALILEMEDIYQSKHLAEYYQTFLKNFYNSVISANIEHNKIHSNSLSNFSQAASLLKTGSEATERFEVGLEVASHIAGGAFKECLTGSVLRLGMTAVGSLLKVMGLSEKENCINNIVNYISDPGSILPLCQILSKELTLKQKALIQDTSAQPRSDDHPKSYMSNLKHLLLSSHDVPTDINTPIKKLAYVHCLNILHAIMVGKLKPVNLRFNLLSFHFSTSPVNYRKLAEDINPALVYIMGSKVRTVTPRQAPMVSHPFRSHSFASNPFQSHPFLSQHRNYVRSYSRNNVQGRRPENQQGAQAIQVMRATQGRLENTGIQGKQAKPESKGNGMK